MRVKDIMRKEYLALQADDAIDHILEEFTDRDITSAPVFEQGEFVGIVSMADIARYFMPKEMIQLWESNSVQPREKLIAGKLAKKPAFTLTADQPVKLVLGKIASSSDCVLVMEEKNVVGVVMPSDLLEFFLAEVAKYEMEESKKKQPEKKKESDAETATAVDKVLEIVRRDGETTPVKVAKELGISLKTAEVLGRLLGKHHLLEIHFSFIGGMIMRRIGHGKK